jgi:hypothetical protein
MSSLPLQPLQQYPTGWHVSNPPPIHIMIAQYHAYSLSTCYLYLVYIIGHPFFVLKYLDPFIHLYPQYIYHSYFWTPELKGHFASRHQSYPVRPSVGDLRPCTNSPCWRSQRLALQLCRELWAQRGVETSQQRWECHRILASEVVWFWNDRLTKGRTGALPKIWKNWVMPRQMLRIYQDFSHFRDANH